MTVDLDCFEAELRELRRQLLVSHDDDDSSELMQNEEDYSLREDDIFVRRKPDGLFHSTMDFTSSSDDGKSSQGSSRTPSETGYYSAEFFETSLQNFITETGASATIQSPTRRSKSATFVPSDYVHFEYDEESSPSYEKNLVNDFSERIKELNFVSSTENEEVQDPTKNEFSLLSLDVSKFLDKDCKEQNFEANGGGYSSALPHEAVSENTKTDHDALRCVSSVIDLNRIPRYGDTKSSTSFIADARNSLGNEKRLFKTSQHDFGETESSRKYDSMLSAHGDSDNNKEQQVVSQLVNTSIEMRRLGESLNQTSAPQSCLLHTNSPCRDLAENSLAMKSSTASLQSYKKERNGKTLRRSSVRFDDETDSDDLAIDPSTGDSDKEDHQSTRTPINPPSEEEDLVSSTKTKGFDGFNARREYMLALAEFKSAKDFSNSPIKSKRMTLSLSKLKNAGTLAESPIENMRINARRDSMVSLSDFKSARSSLDSPIKNTRNDVRTESTPSSECIHTTDFNDSDQDRSKQKSNASAQCKFNPLERMRTEHFFTPQKEHGTKKIAPRGCFPVAPYLDSDLTIHEDSEEEDTSDDDDDDDDSNDSDDSDPPPLEKTKRFVPVGNLFSNPGVIVTKIKSAFSQLDKTPTDVATPINGSKSLQAMGLRRLKILGEGQFGQVWLVSTRRGQGYALKLFAKYDLLQGGGAEMIIREAKMHRQVHDHPFIVKLFSTFQDENLIYMLQEFAQGGELYSVIQRFTDVNDYTEDVITIGMPESHAKFYAACIADAIRHMHSMKVAYRDLKPENCMIDKHGYPQLIDFGYAKYVPDKTFTFCGTPRFLPPEALNPSKGGYDCSIDHWSIGVLIYEMLSGGTNPFFTEGMSELSLFTAIEQDDYRPLDVSPNAVDILSGLLNKNRSLRLGSSDKGGTQAIMQHAWLRDMDLQELLARKVKAPWLPNTKDSLDTCCFDDWSDLEDRVNQKYPKLTSSEEDIFKTFKCSWSASTIATEARMWDSLSQKPYTLKPFLCPVDVKKVILENDGRATFLREVSLVTSDDEYFTKLNNSFDEKDNVLIVRPEAKAYYAAFETSLVESPKTEIFDPEIEMNDENDDSQSGSSDCESDEEDSDHTLRISISNDSENKSKNGSGLTSTLIDSTLSDDLLEVLSEHDEDDDDCESIERIHHSDLVDCASRDERKIGPTFVSMKTEEIPGPQTHDYMRRLDFLNRHCADDNSETEDANDESLAPSEIEDRIVPLKNHGCYKIRDPMMSVTEFGSARDFHDSEYDVKFGNETDLSERRESASESQFFSPRKERKMGVKSLARLSFPETFCFDASCSESTSEYAGISENVDGSKSMGNDPRSTSRNGIKLRKMDSTRIDEVDEDHHISEEERVISKRFNLDKPLDNDDSSDSAPPPLDDMPNYALFVPIGNFLSNFGTGLKTMTASLRQEDYIDKVTHDSNPLDLRMKDLKRLKILGEGQFGQVWLVSDKFDNPYALKLFAKYDLIQAGEAEMIIQETNMHQKVHNHPFIVKLVSTFQDENMIYMVQEFAQGGELFSVIERYSEMHDTPEEGSIIGMPEYQAKFYTACVADAIRHMHTMKVAYRDLKPENCMIDRYGYPVLIDFGYAKYVYDKTFTFCGTPRFLPPEAISTDKGGYDCSVDHWSLGILIYEMLSGGINPFYFDGMSEASLFAAIEDDDFEPLDVSPAATDILAKLLNKNPLQRLGSLDKNGTQDILEHVWLYDMSIESLRDRSVEAPWVPQAKDAIDTSCFDDWGDLEDRVNKKYPKLKKTQEEIFKSFQY